MGAHYPLHTPINNVLRGSSTGEKRCYYLTHNYHLLLSFGEPPYCSVKIYCSFIAVAREIS